MQNPPLMTQIKFTILPNLLFIQQQNINTYQYILNDNKNPNNYILILKCYYINTL